MKRRFSLPVVVLLFVGIVLALVGGWVASLAIGEDERGDWSAWPDSETAQIQHSAVATSTVYLPITRKPGSGLRQVQLPLPLFAAGSAWNQPATTAVPLPESSQQILITYRVLRGHVDDQEPAGTEPFDWPYLVVNYDDYSVAVYGAGSGQQSVTMCQDYDSGELAWPHPKFNNDQFGGPVVVPAPAGEVRPSGPPGVESDGHLVLYDPATFTAYDYYGATTRRDDVCQSWGGGYSGSRILEAGVVDFFDVRGGGANQEGYYSARAHGTPLLGGLLLPEDFQQGRIAHALGFAIPGPRNLSNDPYEPRSSDYFYPASTTEGDFYSTNPLALAAGQRIRLKNTIVDEEGRLVDESQLTPASQMLLTALRDYGAYLVDNAGGFVFYAEDIHSANLNLSMPEVNALTGRPADAPLPDGKTKWQLVMEAIAGDLEYIPIAYGPWEEGQNPATAPVTTYNFEVVEPAVQP